MANSHYNIWLRGISKPGVDGLSTQQRQDQDSRIVTHKCSIHEKADSESMSNPMIAVV